MRGDIRDRVDAVIRDYLDDQLRYEEDYGDDYSHLPREGGWNYNECDRRLAQFLIDKEIETRGLDIETIGDLVLDNFEMVSRPWWYTSSEDEFEIDSYPVGELEVYVPFEFVEDKTRLKLNRRRAEMLSLLTDPSGDLQYYIRSNQYWCAVIDAETLQELIDDEAERQGIF